MTILRYEWFRQRKAFIGWSIGLSLLMLIYLIVYPQMTSDSADLSAMFSGMGSFSKAFGLDQISYGTFEGYFAIESANVAGLGASLYAGCLGISVLAKDHAEKSMEFLLSGPVSRIKLYLEKFCSVVLLILAVNIILWICTWAGCLYIKEEITASMVWLMAACLITQILTAGICFGISAFLRTSSVFAGMGIVLLLYFIQLLSNMMDGLSWMSDLTPFGCSSASWILEHHGLDWPDIGFQFILAGFVFSIGLYWFNRKDL